MKGVTNMVAAPQSFPKGKEIMPEKAVAQLINSIQEFSVKVHVSSLLLI